MAICFSYLRNGCFDCMDNRENGGKVTIKEEEVTTNKILDEYEQRLSLQLCSDIYFIFENSKHYSDEQIGSLGENVMRTILNYALKIKINMIDKINKMNHQ